MITHLIIAIAALLILALLSTWSHGFSRRNRLTNAVNIAEGTHCGALTKFADAALATRYLLVKFGSDVDHVAIAGANDKPLGICSDEVATADLANQPVNVQLLGATGETRKCVISEQIVLTDELYTAANGKVQNLPAGAGTYYKVGRPLQAGAADGDVIEFEPCFPTAVVVP